MKSIYVTAVLFLSLLLVPAASMASCGGPPPVLPHGNGDPGEPPCTEPPCTCPIGAPSWRVNPVNLNLYVTDIPLWYNPAYGPSVNLKIAYNTMVDTAGDEIFGNKWVFRYNEYLTVDGSGNVTVHRGDASSSIYNTDGNGGYVQPYKTVKPLTKISDNHFEIGCCSGKIYVYDQLGNSSDKIFLSEIRNAREQSVYFYYDSNDHLTTITDAQGKITTITYAANLVQRMTDPFGRHADFEYDADRNLTKITDMGGYVTQLEYDDSSVVTAIVNAAGTTSFYIEPPDGIGASLSYPVPGANMRQSSRITVTLPDGKKAEYYYQGNGGVSWYVDPNNYIEYKNANNNNYHAPKTNYYFANTVKGVREEIRSIIYPDGRKKVFVIDQDTARITSQADAAGNVTQYTYTDKGKIKTKTLPNDEVITYTYAANEVDVLKVETGLGTTVNTYNDKHQIRTTKDYKNNITSYEYNTDGQIRKITDPLGIETIYTYNGVGKLIEVKRAGQVLSTMTYDPIGRLKTATDVTGLTTTYDYDNFDHISTITYSDGKTTTYEYNSGAGPHLTTRTTDRSGRVTISEYNAAKQLIRSINPEGGVNRYIYDANANLVQFIDPNANTTSFTYNAGNQLVKKTYADGRSVSFTYYNTGLVKTRRNSRGIGTSYFYDEHYNLVNKTYSDSTPEITLGYDNYNRPISIQDGTGTYTLGYNELSQLISIDGPLENDTITYEYDANGRRTDLSIEGGQSIAYVYDTINRLTKITAGSADYVYAYPDAKIPLIQSLTRPNGSVTSYQYDGLNRLAEVANKNSSAAIINQYVYTYNNQDLRGSEEIINAPLPAGFEEGMKTFEYNAVNQLLSATNPEKLFTYDNDGNMTNGYTVDGYPFVAEYDAEERLTTIEYTDSANVVHKREYTYRWDSFIGRIRKYENNVLTSDIHIVRDQSLALQDRDADNTVIREYVWGQNMGGGIGGLLGMRQDGVDYFYLYDGKGNVTSVLDNNQVTVASYTYSAFGKLMSQSGSLDQPFQFSTKRYDAGIGMNYYGYRFYVPAVERWLNRDPLGEAGGINLYGFVSNDPVNLIDPEGLHGFMLLGRAPFINRAPWLRGGRIPRPGRLNNPIPKPNPKPAPNDACPLPQNNPPLELSKSWLGRLIDKVSGLLGNDVSAGRSIAPVIVDPWST